MSFYRTRFICLLLIILLSLSGCQTREDTKRLMQHPGQLHQALTHCQQGKLNNDQYCQHLKRIKNVLHTFLNIAQQTKEVKYVQHAQSPLYHNNNFQDFQYHTALIEQKFAKKIMQTQSHLATLKKQRKKLEKQLSQQANSDKLSQSIAKKTVAIHQTKDKIEIMYVLVSLNLPTP